jgi:N-acyl-D-amino-acid deacylase
MKLLPRVLAAAFALASFAPLRLALSAQRPAIPGTNNYDVVIRGGTVYDGSGHVPVVTDLGIRLDRIAAIGSIAPAAGRQEIDAKGLAVAPGFINMMSGDDTLWADGHSQSNIRQGVTLEVFGEGDSMGPLTDEFRKYAQQMQGDIKYPITWSTLAEGLVALQKHGVSCNIASFIGADNPRIMVLGMANRAPTPTELHKMEEITDQAMREGALGVASALIYAPGTYAKTPELIAMAKVASKYNGIYISHMRSEGDRLIEAVDELLTIARDAHIRAEIYHLKAAGRDNWHKLDEVIRKVEAARAEGLGVTADMYTYTAGATGLDASMPTWVQEGGYNEWVKRLKDPAIRQRVLAEMRSKNGNWENLRIEASKVLLVEFKNDALKPLTGKTLDEVAKIRHETPEETAIDLVIEDGSRVGTVYFLMSEENVKREAGLPWVSFGADASPLAPEGVFLRSSTHPRSYGNFARFLGKYVRDEHVTTLQDAVRRLSALPAENLRLSQRGQLKPGYFADVVVFDPATITDHATFEKPHQYSTGVVHVFVNGQAVLRNGESTGAMPGRVVWGPGRTVGQ